MTFYFHEITVCSSFINRYIHFKLLIFNLFLNNSYRLISQSDYLVLSCSWERKHSMNSSFASTKDPNKIYTKQDFLISQGGLGWKRPTEIIQTRDIFHQTFVKVHKTWPWIFPIRKYWNINPQFLWATCTSATARKFSSL